VIVRANHVLLLALVLASSILAGCPHDVGATEDGEDDVKANALVAVEPAQKGAVEETITAYGHVEPAAEATEPIVVDVDATVIKVWVKNGQPVKRGDRIADVRDSRAARLDATKAKIDGEFAQKELERVAAQRDKGLATNADVAQAQAELEKAQAELAALGGASATRTLRANGDAIVQSVIVKPGDTVAAGGPLVVISGGAGERIRFGIEGADVPRVPLGAKVHVTSLQGGDAVDAVVAEVHPQIDAETHQASLAVSLPGHALLSGAMCRGQIVIRSVDDAIVVPRKSIVGGAVFIVVDNKAKRVPVEVLIDDGVRAAVKGEALQEGASIVTTGAAELDDGIDVRTTDAMDPRR
jgi:membrane fusion protein (multidrug efflux system)